MTFVVPPPKFDDAYRTEILGEIQKRMNGNERNAQYEIGPSGIGSCERKVAFQLAYGAMSDGDNGWAAGKGTILHAWLEQTFNETERKMPDGSQRFFTETKLDSSAPGVIAGGTCDMYDKLYQRVIDWKCPGDYTMSKCRSGQWSESYYIQAQVYGYHFSLMGNPVQTVALAMLPMAGDDLWGNSKGAILPYWDYDESVAISQINGVKRKKVMLELASHPSVVIDAMPTRSDFCSSCPAFIGSSDRRGNCPGAEVRVPSNPFG